MRTRWFKPEAKKMAVLLNERRGRSNRYIGAVFLGGLDDADHLH